MWPNSNFVTIFIFIIFFSCDESLKVKLWWNLLKNSNYDKTQNTSCDKTQMCQQLKTQIGTKLIKSNCDKTKKPKLGQNSKTQIVTKLKKKLKLWQNSKTQIFKQIQNSNCEGKKTLKLFLDKTGKVKLWQNSKSQIVTKLKFD